MPRIVLLVAFLSTVFSGCTQNNSAKPGAAKSISKTMQPKEMGTLSEVFDSEVAQDDPAEQTAKDRLAETAMGISQDAKSLIKAGRYEDGYQLAKEAMRKFEADNDDLAWIILESIEAGDKRIDVHFNMGERERNFPDNGIVRPLSFRVWSTGEEADLLQIVDFEIGRFDGESTSAAIGEKNTNGHTNHGIMDIDSDYADIRKRVIELVAKQ